MRPLLGTMVEIRANGSASRATEGIIAAFGAIERVQRLMSFHDTDSDVARINAAPVGRIVVVNRETYEVLRYAKTLGDKSGGAFDIAVAPRLVFAGFLPNPQLGGSFPEPSSDNDADSARFSDLELLPGRAVRWRKKGWIDLGGIAKGYAVDAAIGALRSHRIAHGVVNAGGDLRCFGQSVPIHLRSPERPTALIAVGSVQNAAVATSSGYFRGKRVGLNSLDPIVDPGSGTCVTWNASISVIARRCITADALTKVVRLTPAVLVSALLERYDAQAVIMDELGTRTCGRDWLKRDPAATRPPRNEVRAE